MILFTRNPVSPAGKVNIKDIVSICRYTCIFFAAPILMYVGQLSGTLQQTGVLFVRDFVPSVMTIGAVQGWALGIILNFFLKLKDGSK